MPTCLLETGANNMSQFDLLVCKDGAGSMLAVFNLLAAAHGVSDQQTRSDATRDPAALSELYILSTDCIHYI